MEEIKHVLYFELNFGLKSGTFCAMYIDIKYLLANAYVLVILLYNRPSINV